MRHWIAYTVLGLGLFAVWVAPSVQGKAPAPPPPIVRVEGYPHPHNHVVIGAEDTPYTVPPGAILAITGVGTRGAGSCQTSLGVNGDAVVTFTRVNDANVGSVSVYAVPTGLTAHAGDTLDLGCGVIYGYLVRD